MRELLRRRVHRRSMIDYLWVEFIRTGNERQPHNQFWTVVAFFLPVLVVREVITCLGAKWSRRSTCLCRGRKVEHCRPCCQGPCCGVLVHVQLAEDINRIALESPSLSASLLLYLPASLFLSFPASLLSYFPTSLLLWFPDSLLLCFSASLISCSYDTLILRFPDFLLLRFSPSLLSCFPVSLLSYFLASLISWIPASLLLRFLTFLLLRYSDSPLPCFLLLRFPASLLLCISASLILISHAFTLNAHETDSYVSYLHTVIYGTPITMFRHWHFLLLLCYGSLYPFIVLSQSGCIVLKRTFPLYLFRFLLESLNKLTNLKSDDRLIKCPTNLS